MAQADRATGVSNTHLATGQVCFLAGMVYGQDDQTVTFQDASVGTICVVSAFLVNSQGSNSFMDPWKVDGLVSITLGTTWIRSAIFA